MAKNHRQPYAVSAVAGHQHSAESWGTGRAVSRIPRVSGGGTHRAGQAAFGNMCRKGRMFAPTKTWRKWNQKINQKQKRFAVASALAASCVTPLVLARGHKVEKIKEIPLVIADSTITKIEKTRDAEALLVKLNAYADVEKVWDSRRLRAGKGKLRNRRYKTKRGPLVVYSGKPNFIRAFRNLPGVEFCSVDSLNLLKLAPGSHLGRFIIWQEAAFRSLDKIYGTFTKKSGAKADFTLPRSLVTNADLARLINSDEIQSVVRPTQINKRRGFKKNPLKNIGVLVRLNPYAAQQKRDRLLAQEKVLKQRREKVVKTKRNPKSRKTARRKARGSFLKALLAP
eukprot:TRINITY_DN1885_c1_g1_i1.p2 TRINITY_DN1885_c1_g1~~TRINITY_DN1885_c1_g1_i1.p2  ORF type:complete len:340 (-),score=89.54 TRINITY_DN1885_c1_g1_i1:46-1065(-)